jgi:hypothetical protein
VGHRGQALAPVVGAQVAVDPSQHLVGGGQAAGGLHHEGAVRAGVDHVELAEGADVVDPRVGAGVGQEQQPGVEAEGEAVGHPTSMPEPPDGPFRT